MKNCSFYFYQWFPRKIIFPVVEISFCGISGASQFETNNDFWYIGMLLNFLLFTDWKWSLHSDQQNLCNLLIMTRLYVHNHSGKLIFNVN